MTTKHRTPMGSKPMASRPGTGNNGPGSRSKKKMFWTKNAHGILLQHWGRSLTIECVGDEDVMIRRSDKSAHGFSLDKIYTSITYLLPDAEAEYNKYGYAVPFKDALGLKLRYQYMQMVKGKRVAKYSTSHPLHSKILKPYTDRAETYYIKGKPLRKPEVDILFDPLNPPPVKK